MLCCLMIVTPIADSLMPFEGKNEATVSSVAFLMPYAYSWQAALLLIGQTMSWQTLPPLSSAGIPQD